MSFTMQRNYIPCQPVPWHWLCQVPVFTHLALKPCCILQDCWNLDWSNTRIWILKRRCATHSKCWVICKVERELPVKCLWLYLCFALRGAAECDCSLRPISHLGLSPPTLTWCLRDWLPVCACCANSEEAVPPPLAIQKPKLLTQIDAICFNCC